MATQTAYNVDQLLEEWRINGFVVFEDLIPPEIIDRIREAWIPHRDREIQKRDPTLKLRRYNVRVPYEQPFVEPAIFEHPALVEFLEHVLGKDYVWCHFDSNTPFPGVDYQPWHRDCPLLFPGIMTPAFSIGVKFPLVDTNVENGSFEVLPGTQYLADADLQNGLDRVFGPGEQHRGHYSPIRLNLKKGSLWVQDGRAFHRGTTNRSDHTRDELCMGMTRPWFSCDFQRTYTEKHFPRDLWESLSDHARHVLRWQRVKD